MNFGMTLNKNKIQRVRIQLIDNKFSNLSMYIFLSVCNAGIGSAKPKRDEYNDTLP